MELHGIVRLNADGMPDPTFTPPAMQSAIVYSLLPQSEGRVLIGGYIYLLEGGYLRKAPLRLNSNGLLDTNFFTEFNVDNPIIYALAQATRWPAAHRW